MDASLNEKVKLSIQNLRDKKSRIYFLDPHLFVIFEYNSLNPFKEYVSTE